MFRPVILFFFFRLSFFPHQVLEMEVEQLVPKDKEERDLTSASDGNGFSEEKLFSSHQASRGNDNNAPLLDDNLDGANFLRHEEARAVLKRFADEKLRSLLELDGRMPTVAVACSGGGARAFVSALAFRDALQKHGLLDCVTVSKKRCLLFHFNTPEDLWRFEWLIVVSRQVGDVEG